MRNIEKHNKEDYFLFIALDLGVHFAFRFYQIQVVTNDLVHDCESINLFLDFE